MTDAPKAVKLPYFHRTLSPEDTALIGDITPKPISSSTTATAASAAANPAGRTALEGSAWNAAQTWEERDCTSWGKNKLREVFASSSSASGDVSFVEASKVEGNASITHVRGRARFMYDWNFTVEVSVLHDGRTYEANADITEAINDSLEDMDCTVSFWKGTTVSREEHKVLTAKVAVAVVERVKEFETQFRAYRPN